MKRRGIMKIAAYLLFYGVARFLPLSHEYGIVGGISHKFRRALCRILIDKAAPVFGVEKGARFGWGDNLIMKDHANLGENCRIGGRGKVVVGRHVMMGPDVVIITQDHKIMPEGFDGFNVKDVEIGDYAWIGIRVIILKGVRIGKYSVIGAGAVVTRDIPDYAVAAGSPARVIRMRNNNE